MLRPDTVKLRLVPAHTYILRSHYVIMSEITPSTSVLIHMERDG
jgi:hypothetical protein